MASMVLSVPRAGGGNAIVGGGTSRGNPRTAHDDADHFVAGNYRKIFRLVVISWPRTVVDGAVVDHDELSGPAGQWRHFDHLCGKLADGRFVSGDQLHHL